MNMLPGTGAHWAWPASSCIIIQFQSNNTGNATFKMRGMSLEPNNIRFTKDDYGPVHAWLVELRGSVVGKSVNKFARVTWVTVQGL